MNTLKQISCIAVAFLTVASCTGNKDAEKTKVEELPIVKLENVMEEEVPMISNYTATVEAYKSNNITTSTANRIKRILVDVGTTVGAGQTVVILDDVNIDQMRLRLENQKREYERALELLKIGGGTQQAVDQLRTEYDAYKRSYANMRENTTLVSPISGVVTVRNYDNGDMTGQLPILTIEQILPVKILVNVSEQDFTKIFKGQKVTVKLDVYGEETFDGYVKLIHPTIDPTTRTFVVEIEVSNKDKRIRPGMFARVEMNFGVQNHVVVSDRAIVKQTGSGNRYVYVYKDGKVSYNKVEIGQRLGNRYELLSGVENNSQVVVSGQTRLANGVKVQVAKDGKTPIKK
ncbi:MAG: efflux RND transporter periplasmic adaptor subunit [Muribaculaceae bacterium]